MVLEEYTYGASRERLRKEANNQRTYYAWGGSSVLCEYTETETVPSWAKSYIYAGSRLLSTITNTAGAEVVEYHHPDRLGTRLISNPATATQVEQNTLPFGTSIAAETSGTSNQRFTSYDRSSTTGLDYAVNRTYNSSQSRFTQVDPIGMGDSSLLNPQSMNLYAYVRNNPIDFIDPSGLNLSSGICARGYLTTVWFGNNKDGWRIVSQHLDCYDTGGGGQDNSYKLNDEEVKNLRRDTEIILRQPGCAEFLKELLGNASTERNPSILDNVSTNEEIVQAMLSQFDKIHSQGGFLVKDTGQWGGKAKGSVGGGDAQIQVDPRAVKHVENAAPKYRRDAELLFAFQQLNELIHHSGENYAYADYLLARAIEPYKKSPAPTNTLALHNSPYFHTGFGNKNDKYGFNCNSTRAAARERSKK